MGEKMTKRESARPCPYCGAKGKALAYEPETPIASGEVGIKLSADAKKKNAGKEYILRTMLVKVAADFAPDFKLKKTQLETLASMGIGEVFDFRPTTRRELLITEMKYTVDALCKD
jgi:hypothetical protein